LSTVKFLLRDILERKTGSVVHIHDIDFYRTVAILRIENGQLNDYQSHIEGIAEEVSSVLLKKYGVKIQFAAGNIVHDILDMGRSFDEAKQAMEYCLSDNDEGVLWYSKIPKESMGYYYPINLELQLINAAKAGLYEDIEKILREVYIENSLRKQLLPYMKKQLIYNMYGTVQKLLDQIPTDQSQINIKLRECVQMLDHNIFFDEVFDSLRDMYASICSTINCLITSKNLKQKQTIIDYIEEHFMDSELCLSKIASEFSFTEVYISMLVKDMTGYPFSTYLENIRMRYACEYLCSNEYTISEIAEMVGYNSAHAFRRAFKRSMGVNP
jgi:two-component system response regulator YesN